MAFPVSAALVLCVALLSQRSHAYPSYVGCKAALTGPPTAWMGLNISASTGVANVKLAQTAAPGSYTVSISGLGPAAVMMLLRGSGGCFEKLPAVLQLTSTLCQTQVITPSGMSVGKAGTIPQFTWNAGTKPAPIATFTLMWSQGQNTFLNKTSVTLKGVAASAKACPKAPPPPPPKPPAPSPGPTSAYPFKFVWGENPDKSGGKGVALKWRPHQGQVDVELQVPMAACGKANTKPITWVGVGFSKDGMMIGPQNSAVVGQLVTGANVSLYMLKGGVYGPTGVSLAPDQKLAATRIATSGGVTTLQFTRPYMINGTFGIGKSETKVIWACGTGMSGLADGHFAPNGANDATPAAINFATGAGGAATTDVVWLVQIHAVVMALAWAVLAPSGVCAAVFGRKLERKVSGTPWWFWVHTNFNQTAVLFTLVGTVTIVVQIGWSNVFVLPTLHHKIGLAMFFGAVVQGAGGIGRGLFGPTPKPGEEKTTGRFVWEILHRLVATGLLLGGVYQLYSGPQLIGSAALLADKCLAILYVVPVLLVVWIASRRPVSKDANFDALLSPGKPGVAVGSRQRGEFGTAFD